jgi:hypothetical protein|tara:strand:+ start:256 stop:960 length:705 start_codon:yes stop_codon:yes gene_type:complete
VLISRLRKSFKELNWGVLTIEMVMLILGISISLQVNEWQNKQVDRQLEQEYLARLNLDFDESEKVLRKDIEYLRSSVEKLVIGIKPLSKSSLTKEDHIVLFKAVGQSTLIGRFAVVFGTIDELKDTGNMRLLVSKKLRISLANLYQSYQQIIRLSELRNILRGQSFPVLVKQLKPNSNSRVIWDEELAEKNKREIFGALTVILQNLKNDLSDTEKLAELVAKIKDIIKQELEKN